MFEQKDIDEAKKLFLEWDLHRTWHIASAEFVTHVRKKAKDSLSLAVYLLEKVKNTQELVGNDTITLWIVTTSYYSMFFEVEFLLGLDGRKLPLGTKDTHKTIYLAFLYYYVIKGSELERKEKREVTTTKISKALSLFKELQDETLELQRLEKSVRDLKVQREQRHAFTYQMSKSAEVVEAQRSVAKASEFRQLVEEYIISREH